MEAPLEVVIGQLDDLKPAVPLDEIVSSTKFRLIGYELDSYDVFDVISVDVITEELFRLEEDIFDALETFGKNGVGFLRPPEPKEVVLAKKNNGGYKRAVIVSNPTAKEVQVYFLDAGGKYFVKSDELKPVSNEIMKYPILAHRIFLQGGIETSRYFTKEAFSLLMKEMAEQTFTLEIAEKVTKKKPRLVYSHNVVLSYCDDSQRKILLKDKIKDLETWEWQKFSNGRDVDDEEVCENGKYRNNRITDKAQNILVVNSGLIVGLEFSARISRVVKDGENENVALVIVTFLDLPNYQNYNTVLQAQMARYAASVKALPFYPALNERVMFKLKTTDATREKYGKLVKAIDQWCRGIRVGDLIYLIDYDDYIPFNELPQEEYEIRRIYEEFFTIPTLSVKLLIHRDGKPIPFKAAATIFRPNTRYIFEITGYCTERDQNLYTCEFRSCRPTLNTN